MLLKLAQSALKNRNQIKHGQQSLKKLNLQGNQLDIVKIPGQDIAAFRRQLNKYSVDFSVMKDRKTGEHLVFFKGQDTNRVYAGLEKVLEKNINRNNDKKPRKEVFKQAKQKSLQRAEQLTKPLEKKHTINREER